MQILGQKNYRSVLKEILFEKTKKNPSYSLRSFAGKLGLAPSYLSAVIRGKKNLSPQRSVEISELLELEDTEKEYFQLLVQIEATRSPELKESFLKQAHRINPIQQVQLLELDQFKLISDWHHFAILAATELTRIEVNESTLSKLLGIHKVTIDVAVDRLIRLGLLQRDENSCLRKTKSNPRVESSSANEALRTYHRQTLKKAIESLSSQTPAEKLIGSETLAIDIDQIDEYRECVEKFFEEMCRISKKRSERNKVYHLGVQFFDLTNSKFKTSTLKGDSK